MLHGPLARTELGEWQVQGTDYAYTIHGWIKGVNAETLSPGRDIGQDGHSSGSHTSFARDAFGFALHYYEGDYTAISQPTVANHFLTDDAAFHSFNQGSYVQPKSLYNGNIMMMHTALMDQDNARVEEQRMKYEYDQLHRIHSWYSYRDTGLYADNTWELTTAQQTNDYSGSVSYTPNGDIRYLNRFGRFSEPYVVKDRFGYGYYNSGNNRFRLRYVNDLKASAGPLDMGPQPLDNYTYYDNGHLKSDSADFIRKIHWNVANKIDRIVFAPDSAKPEQIIFRYDAMGQRRVKLVQPDLADSTTWAYTYYVRDAQGNVMTTYERGHFDPSGTATPTGYSGSTDWDSLGIMGYLKASEYHLYGSDRLGIYSPELYLGFYNDSLISVPYGYDPLAYDGDPCGCDTSSTCSNPPCDPCWCEDDDLCGCPACLNCIDCYCSGWPTTDFSFTSASHQVRGFIRGRKHYELKNHLGNVLEVISDRKLQITTDSLTVDGYTPDIWAWHDYNPFGTTQQARSWQATGYRYGFQGQEADDELFGANSAIAFRMYDARIGRFLSIDPLAAKYPWNSPYAFSENRVIDGVELEGLEYKRIDQVGEEIGDAFSWAGNRVKSLAKQTAGGLARTFLIFSFGDAEMKRQLIFDGANSIYQHGRNIATIGKQFFSILASGISGNDYNVDESEMYTALRIESEGIVDAALGGGVGITGFYTLNRAVSITAKMPFKLRVKQKLDNIFNRKRKWTKEDGSIDWPDNDGFLGERVRSELRPGTVVDRYGHPGGRFVAPEGTPFVERSLAPGTETQPFHRYEVMKPVEVDAGISAPHFDEVGGGVQYKFDRPIQELIDDGILKDLDK